MDAAIDKHVIPRYDKTYNMLNIIAFKFKNGTYHFNYLSTVNCATDSDSRAFLGTTLVRMDDDLDDIVSKFVMDVHTMASGLEC